MEEWSDTTDVEVRIRKSAAVRGRTNRPLSRDRVRTSTIVLHLGDFCAHFSPPTTWQYCWDTLRWQFLLALNTFTIPENYIPVVSC